MAGACACRPSRLVSPGEQCRRRPAPVAPCSRAGHRCGPSAPRAQGDAGRVVARVLLRAGSCRFVRVHGVATPDDEDSRFCRFRGTPEPPPSQPGWYRAEPHDQGERNAVRKGPGPIAPIVGPGLGAAPDRDPDGANDFALLAAFFDRSYVSRRERLGSPAREVPVVGHGVPSDEGVANVPPPQRGDDAADAVDLLVHEVPEKPELTPRTSLAESLGAEGGHPEIVREPAPRRQPLSTAPRVSDSEKSPKAPKPALPTSGSRRAALRTQDAFL